MDGRPLPLPDPESQEDWVRRLLAVGRSLTSELDRGVVLERVLDTARQMSGARYAALGILNDDHTGLENFLASGIDEETRNTIGDLPRGRGVLGVLIQYPQTLRLADVSSHASSYGFPSGHPVMKSFLGVPIVIRGQVWGNLYLTEKQGGEFTERDEEAAVLLAGWAAIAIDNAMMYEFSEARRRESERTARGLEMTRDVAVAIGTDFDLDRVLQLIAKRGRALVESDSMLIWLRDGDDLVVRASAGDAGEDVEGTRVPVDGSVAGRVIAGRETLRIGKAGQRRSIRLATLGEAGRQATLVVPMVSRGLVVGAVLAIGAPHDGADFTEDDEQLLITFTASAANAVALAQSVESDRLRGALAATEAERARWARELHDETLQSLAGLRMQLTAAVSDGQDLESTRSAVGAAVAELAGEIESLRAMISELRPPALDDLGLCPAIESLVDRHRARDPLQIQTTLEIQSEHSRGKGLDPDFESTVYRLVQEALTNVARHASATRAHVALHEDTSTITVEVTDDGCGFDEAAARDGFGLTGMRERVGLAGGNMKVTSGPGGTRVHASLPVPRSNGGG
jgi:signal transduction histidine kinase